MKRSILMTLVVFAFSACVSHAVLTKKNYIQMSDGDIKNVLLAHTPIGSNEEKVRKVMSEEFGVKLKKIIVEDNPNILEETKNSPDPFVRKIELNDYHLHATLARHGWAKHFFLMGYTVEASWLFSKDGLLKDIRVSHLTDGI